MDIDKITSIKSIIINRKIVLTPALNRYIFLALTNNEKLIEYWASVDNVESSNPCVGPISRIEVSFFLLSKCTDVLISTPKIMTFLPTLLSGNENSERKSNSIP